MIPALSAGFPKCGENWSKCRRLSSEGFCPGSFSERGVRRQGKGGARNAAQVGLNAELLDICPDTGGKPVVEKRAEALAAL